ncbi:hypothetical protein B0H17DRAFT_1176361 [Mycena rosella]|uniref:RING-type domain-containing protein n=1 Tax=Mycena rosella TaxID=1033263 RepID=A0AAD7DZU3_MYCRO|nr:hypothetical protein B0H17DRAFT_1176361 [Mycena rosella]
MADLLLLLSNICLATLAAVILLACSKFPARTIPEALTLLRAASASFCADILTLSLYAILTALSLCIAFLGITAIHPILSATFPFLASTQASEPESESQLSTVARLLELIPKPLLDLLAKRAPASTPPPPPPPPKTFSHRWIAHTHAVLHPRPGRTAPAPLSLFLSLALPALLLYFVARQRQRALTARDAEVPRRLAAARKMLTAQKVCAHHAQPVAALRAGLHCPLCAKPFTLPYALAPCGHTFDLRCLQQHFLSLPSNTCPRPRRLDLTTLPKLCPTCGTAIAAPPALAWTVKTIADALAADPRTRPRAQPRDPWSGFFRNATPRPVSTVVV